MNTTRPERIVYAHQAVTGGWMVSENDIWLPGVYDTSETALLAADLDPDTITGLANRAAGTPITADDVAGAM